ncbi:transcriptional regulator, TetR family [Kribbella flavida DSM 17836]|uniref:Transcriptional regulator, TetR family n=1 Tax=Kribbella flavida (strain DSM 17836 / JCM 10339 / NBRC 14399) TaxID=479435 RepID=D2Q3S1_KRIFD|nr:TetR/AcrR family transcriptional regulator [Kribbella flavida]ADB35943.1 transcriptional regulator, TetR family [Kribbella flavida DSM 17836]
MSSPQFATRPGGRTARVRSDVLRATEQELAEHGYESLAIDAVAARSGVHRTTIYRRWKTVDGLLSDLLEAGRDDHWAPADTGSLESDLIALNREVHAALASGPSVTTAVIAASFRTPQAAAALTRFWDDRYERSAVLVTRAAERGEIPADTAAEDVVMAATSPIYHQLVLRRRAMSRADADWLARATAAAAKAGAFAR